MAQRGKQTFGKRQREMERQERARDKEAKRQERREAGPDESDEVDEAALMAKYGQLAEAHAAGKVDDERFAEAKREIFEALGLDVD